MTGPGSAATKYRFSEAVEEAGQVIDSELSRNLLDHWLECAAETPPTRWSIDPTKLLRCLPHIFLMAFERGSRSLSYILAGEEVQAGYETTLKDQSLSDVVPDDVRAEVSEYFLACVEGPAIIILSGRLYQERLQPGLGERLLLPLFSDDERQEPAGLIGLTHKRRDFPDRATAYRDATRIMTTIPLSGGESRRRDY